MANSMEQPKKLIECLRENYDSALKEEYVDMDAASWGYEEGVVLSYNELKQLLDYIYVLEQSQKKSV